VRTPDNHLGNSLVVEHRVVYCTQVGVVERRTFANRVEHRVVYCTQVGVVERRTVANRVEHRVVRILVQLVGGSLDRGSLIAHSVHACVCVFDGGHPKKTRKRTFFSTDNSRNVFSESQVLI